MSNKFFRTLYAGAHALFCLQVILKCCKEKIDKITDGRKYVCIQPIHHAYFIFGKIATPKTFGFLSIIMILSQMVLFFQKIEIPLAIVALLENNMLCHSFSQQCLLY